MAKVIVALGIPTLLITLIAWWMGGPIIASGTAILFCIMHSIIILRAPKILQHFIHGKYATSDEEKRFQEYVNAQKVKYGVERVTLLIAPSPQPNVASFGLSRSNAFIVITKGALELIDIDDTKAMLHNALAVLSDVTIAKHTVIAVYASIMTTISQMGQFSILSEHNEGDDSEGNSLSALIFFLVAPLASFFIKLLADRTLYLRADKRSSSITRKPAALADAIHKVDIAVRQYLPLIAPNPSLAFLYMVQPFANTTLRRLFDIHPEEKTRIDKVANMII